MEIPAEVARAEGVPDDLDASAVGPYAVPTTRRRRIAAAVSAIGAVLAVAGILAGLPAGLWVMAGFLAPLAVWQWLSAWPIEVSAEQALAAANRITDFPVGHASAMVGFDGWRSRPVWNVLVFSADEPPSQRGLVRVDAVGGEVVGSYVEDNPEIPA
jgi:hypothetical protein